ncbi:hypothetical protein [Allonocardiopsis opalescens]|uniref:Uncharacterized protein n=1 Tax=Allonocardiopsis opalescens TaxID=1144618 RepID=A0A2T0PZQ4_9ACTN|nr:hypothetical protein [Allonocardiopsis opalescens]PRX97014.1 hypothetical protein CLV72_10650 [Allonocardiopsis opalescens]
MTGSRRQGAPYVVHKDRPAIGARIWLVWALALFGCATVLTWWWLPGSLGAGTLIVPLLFCAVPLMISGLRLGRRTLVRVDRRGIRLGDRPIPWREIGAILVTRAERDQGRGEIGVVQQVRRGERRGERLRTISFEPGQVDLRAFARAARAYGPKGTVVIEARDGSRKVVPA